MFRKTIDLMTLGPAAQEPPTLSIRVVSIGTKTVILQPELTTKDGQTLLFRGNPFELAAGDRLNLPSDLTTELFTPV